jgi:hypothetical protein
MANRRVWSALSSDYRTRLTRSGITQAQYEGGASLKAARGHRETPEHPEEAIRQPSKYQKYRNKMKGLQQQVQDRKEQLWGSRFKFHDVRSRSYVVGKEKDVKAPGVKKMLDILSRSDDEWEQLVLDAAMAGDEVGVDDDWRFLFYH